MEGSVTDYQLTYVINLEFLFGFNLLHVNIVDLGGVAVEFDYIHLTPDYSIVGVADRTSATPSEDPAIKAWISEP